MWKVVKKQVQKGRAEDIPLKYATEDSEYSRYNIVYADAKRQIAVV